MENSQEIPLPLQGTVASAPCSDGFANSFDAIARFCADQHYDFDPDAWRHMASRCEGTLQVLARYLAGTSWYGHSEMLESVARMGDDRDGPLRRTSGIDIARFSGAIRVHIVRRRRPGNASESSEEV